MRNIFGHQPDGNIYIDMLVPMPLDFYVQRHPDYALPIGIIRREYMPGEYHRLYTADSVWHDGGAWAEGDALIASAAEDAAAYLESIKPPEPEPPADPPPTDEEIAARQLAIAREKALAALDDQRLSDAMKGANPPVEVKDWHVAWQRIDTAKAAAQAKGKPA